MSETPRLSNKLSGISGNIIFVLLLSMIVLSPLPFGSVVSWSHALWLSCCLFILCLWIGQSCLDKQIRIIRSWLWIPLFLFLSLILLQTLTLSSKTLGSFSPQAVYLHQKLGTMERQKSISIYPYATFLELIRFSILLLTFFITVHIPQKSRKMKILISVILVMAACQVFYGFSQQFTKTSSLFGIQNEHRGTPVGTFRNRNHLCGLLEMVSLIAVGFFIALIKKKHVQKNFWAKLSEKENIYLFSIAILALISLAGVLLSFSKGGVVATSAGLLFFFCAIFRKNEMGRKFWAIIILLMLAFAFLFYLGMERWQTRIEQGLILEDSSFQSRIVLVKSAWPMVKDFLWTGCGWGTFRFIFRYYQSSAYQDYYVDYLHNDWLQIVCETGIIGFLFLTIIVVTGFIAIFFRLRKQENYFKRNLGMGALAAVLAMLVHSLVDFNLMRITSNGILFCFLFGLAFVYSHNSESLRYWKIPLNSAVWRVALFCGICFACYWPVHYIMKIASAEIEYHRFLAWHKNERKYPYLPFGNVEEQKAIDSLSRALAIDSNNADHYYYRGKYVYLQMKKQIREEATERAIKLAGEHLQINRPKTFERLVFRFMPLVQQQKQDIWKQSLDQAIQLVDQAIIRCPTIDYYHKLRTQMLAYRLHLLYRQAIPESEQKILFEAIERSLLCAPNRPAQLFAMAEILIHYSRTGKEKHIARIQHYLYKVLHSDETYSDKVYPLVVYSLYKPELLFEVTPKYYIHYQRLYNFLWQRKDYSRCLVVLQKMETIPFSPFWRHKKKFFRLQEIDRAQKKAVLLEILGKWQEREIAKKEYRRVLRNQSMKKREKAQLLMSRGDIRAAYIIYRQILKFDWHYREALFECAELASLPQFSPKIIEDYEEPLDLLYDILLVSPEMSENLRQKIVDLIYEILAESNVQAKLIEAASYLSVGQAEKSLKLLEKQQKSLPKGSWAGASWYFRARGYDSLGKKTEAIEAWQKVKNWIPTHKAAHDRLKELAPKLSTSIPEPEIKREIVFGGKVKWLGYTIKDDNIIIYWQFLDKMKKNIFLRVEFLDKYEYSLKYYYPKFFMKKMEYSSEWERTGEILSHAISLEEISNAHYIRLSWTGKNKVLYTDLGTYSAMVPIDLKK